MAKRKQEMNRVAAATDGEEAMSKDLTQYVTTKQAAEMLGIVPTSVNHLLIDGRIKGQKLGHYWLVV